MMRTKSEVKDFVTNKSEVIIMWTKPEYSDMRFGFEVTMYICNR